jgi:hypothetical protein
MDGLTVGLFSLRFVQMKLTSLLLCASRVSMSCSCLFVAADTAAPGQQCATMGL